MSDIWLVFHVIIELPLYSTWKFQRRVLIILEHIISQFTFHAIKSKTKETINSGQKMHKCENTRKKKILKRGSGSHHPLASIRKLKGKETLIVKYKKWRSLSQTLKAHLFHAFLLTLSLWLVPLSAWITLINITQKAVSYPFPEPFFLFLNYLIISLGFE